MKAQNSLARRLRRLPLPLLAAATLAIGGCARVPAGIGVVSQKDNQAFSEKFPARFITRGAGGDYHIILLKDGTKVSHHAASTAAKSGAPLDPVRFADVRQVMHIHVFWQPMRAAKTDNPSATNSAIDWYLVRADGQRITGLAHYEGAGLTTVSVAEDEAGVIIRSGSLKPTLVEGDLIDPVGPISLSGRFDARYRPAAVNDVLAQLDKLKAGGTTSGVDPARLTQPASAAAASAR